MALLADSVPTTLGALVGATTFAAGFLSTRVHRERERALTVAKEADDAVDSAARAGVAVDPALLRSQEKALDDAANDQLNNLAVALVAVLALSVVTLVLSTASSTPVAWLSADGRLLLTFAGVALVVLVVSTVDVLVARREVSRRRAGTAVAMMQQADRAWTGRRRRSGKRRPSGADLARSRAVAEDAVRAGRGLYGPAWQVLGNACLASLSDPSMFRPDEWVRAAAALDRAADLGIDTAPFRAARAYAREIGPEPDVDEASREWIRAMWLHHEATRPLSHTDRVVQDPGSRQWQTGTTSRGHGVVADPATWRFRPQHPRTLSVALDQIPAVFAEAGVTAQLLAASTVTHPEAAEDAARSAVAWLERRRGALGELGHPLLVRTAGELLQASAASAWRESIETYLGPDGPIQAAERHAREAEQRQQRELEEDRTSTQAAMLQWTEQNRAMEQSLLRRRAQAEADQERWERIDRGEATVEDLEAEEAMVQQAVRDAEEHEAVSTEGRREESAQRSENEERWHAEGKQQAEADARWQEDLQSALDRLDRSQKGRATTDEVAEAVERVPSRPWPEPTPCPSPLLPR